MPTSITPRRKSRGGEKTEADIGGSPSSPLPYRSHHFPKGRTPSYWLEWIQFWWYRFGVETGVRELEPLEQLFCCKSLLVCARAQMGGGAWERVAVSL